MKRIILRALAYVAAPIYLPAAWFKAFRLSRKKKKLKELYDVDRAYKFILRVAKFIRLFYNIKIDVIDLDKWSTTPGLIVANHQSNADGLILMLALLADETKNIKAAYIAKQELIDDKKFAPFLKTLNTYFIDRQNLRQIVEVFDEAKKEITEKRNNLVVFPEGTRSKSPHMKEFSPGAFKLAIQTYSPVKPVAFIDTYRLFETGKKKGKHVKVVFCDEIPADKLMAMNTVGLASYIYETIKTKVDEHSTVFEEKPKN